MPSGFTSDDAEFVRVATTQGRAVQALWDAHGDEIAQKYAGEWIALRGAEIIDHAREPEQLRARLEKLGRAGRDLMIRWIPPSDAEFAFQA